MKIREPAVAGSFYPLGASELKKTIEKFFSLTEVRSLEARMIVSPHAGYEYCGKTAASVYKSAEGKFDTIVVIGPNHSGSGAGVATSLDAWKTPFGNVRVDEEFAKALMKGSLITEDCKAHAKEHSIEVQLPWLQYKFGEFKFVPISISSDYFDAKSCKEIGTKIAEAAKKLKRNILIVASSDFTHHGSMYDNVIYKGTPVQVLKKIKDADTVVAQCATKLMPEKLIEVCDEGKCTVCGYGAIAAGLWAAKALGAKKGEVIGYSTSYAVSKDMNAIVGYCGIVIY
jgi:AmmeMemoRadiSam system protein B